MKLINKKGVIKIDSTNLISELIALEIKNETYVSKINGKKFSFRFDYVGRLFVNGNLSLCYIWDIDLPIDVEASFDDVFASIGETQRWFYGANKLMAVEDCQKIKKELESFLSLNS